MPEGLQVNKDQGIEELRRKKYEDYRKEILAFKDLPESTFSNVKDNSGRILEPQEARSLDAHDIMRRIDGEARIGLFDQKLHFELVHLWEKEILGRTERRIMYDGPGNIVD